MIVWMYLKVLQTQKIVVSDSDDFKIPTKNEIFLNQKFVDWNFQFC